MTLFRTVRPGLARPEEDHPEPQPPVPPRPFTPVPWNQKPRGMDGDPCGSGPINAKDAATRREP